MKYAANCQISSPVKIAATSDVNLNGFHFSYTVGLMFPPQAAIDVPLRAPYPVNQQNQA